MKDLLISAAVGDIAGMPYEFGNRTKNYDKVELLDKMPHGKGQRLWRPFPSMAASTPSYARLQLVWQRKCHACFSCWVYGNQSVRVH